jgi:hypothetical protein
MSQLWYGHARQVEKREKSGSRGAEKLATGHPAGTPHVGLSAVQLSEIAAQQLQHLLLLARIAALLLQAVYAMTES